MTSDWRNLSYDILAESGEDVEEMKKNEFPPIPDPGLLSGVSLSLKTTLFKSLFFYRSFNNRRRLTHTAGIGAIGIATVVSDPKFPPNDFFTPERVFSVRLRHANLTLSDDRLVDVRAASLKFANVEEGGPLDLIMNTGRACPFWNGPTVKDFMVSKAGKKELKEWLHKNSAYYYWAVDGSRRAPSSYSKLSYYSQVTMEMIDNECTSHHVRFRLIPADYGGHDDGLLDERDQRNYAEEWDVVRAEDDTRAPNYLHAEFRGLFANGGAVHYALQLQRRYVAPGESLEVYNMGRAWDLDRHPWLDVARVTLFRALHPDVTERLQFNVANLPACVALPETPSFEDYRSVGHLRRAIYAAAQKARLWKFNPSAPPSTGVSYRFTVDTVDTKQGGYDGDVHVIFFGSKGETGALKLHKSRMFGDDFGKGEKSSFELKAEDVGHLWAVHLTLANKADGWFIGMMTVEKGGVSIQFPCFHWVYEQAIIRSGKATLAFNDSPEQQAIRALEKQARREMTPWQEWCGMPSHIRAILHADLARDYQFGDEKTADFYMRRDEGRFNYFYKLITEGVAKVFKEIQGYHHYNTFFHFNVGQNKVPCVAERWQSDREFGRQFLQGPHPTSIRRVVGKLPHNFPLSGESVRMVLGRNVTLKDEIDAGRVYIVDCKSLVGIPTAAGRHVTPAMGLFYVNASNDFVPLAIQLDQQPGLHNPIWTPADTFNDWLLAKMHLRCADAQIHQINSHLLMTHLVIEPFGISMFRNLPRVHPVFKLLCPHLRYTMAINTIGRAKLVGDQGLADQVLSIGRGGHVLYIKRCYSDFDFRRLSLPYDLAERNVSDASLLPPYYYRDDGLLIWNAVHRFVADLMAIYYASDDDVRDDDEIQEWIGEVHAIGFPQNADDVDHHVPSRFDAIDDLVDALTAIVFTSSAEHAAQNFGQYDYYAYYPNAPMTMRQPPPSTRGATTTKSIIESLGGTDQVSFQLLTVWLLSTKSRDEVYLGQFPEAHFVDPQARVVIAKFQEDLKEIEACIDERNRHLEVPYTYLKPSEIPKSIAV